MKKIKGVLLKNKYAVLILLLGVALLLIPIGGSGESKKEETTPSSTEISAPQFNIEAEEARLSETVSKIDGAGKTSVRLSADGSVMRTLAANGEETLVLSGGSDGERALELKYYYPAYTGAVVVCEGAESADVRLKVLSAVTTFTGLRSDKIAVIKMRT